jgi:TFIIF-interacting CTD phosphatase-like protein
MVNIILDLDETLIHTIVSDRPRSDLEKKSDFKFQFQPAGAIYYVFKRPGLEEFLSQIFSKFRRVGVWTAADKQYAKKVVMNIMSARQISNLDFVFSRDFCESDRIGFTKPLSKIYTYLPVWKPEETIMLDNSPQVMKYNPKNGMVAPDYAEPHLDHDIYLHILTDIFGENLPKCRVYKFIERINHVVPYVISLYELEDEEEDWGVKNFSHGRKNKGITRSDYLDIKKRFFK